MNGPGMHGFGKTLAGSVVLHAVLMAVAALAFTGANHVFITPVYTVDLVAGPAVRKAQPIEAPAPEPVKEERAPEPMKAEKAPEPPAAKPAQTVKIKEQPSVADALKKIEKKVEKRQDEALVSSSIDELKKKMEAERQSRERLTRLKEEIGSRAEPARQEKAIAPPSAAQARPASGGGARRANLEERYSAYYGVLRDRVQENWIYPQGLKDDRISVIVTIKIAKNGKLLDASVEKSSGNRAFDDSLIKAIKKAEPFPPLPADLEGAFLETGLRFCPGCAQ